MYDRNRWHILEQNEREVKMLSKDLGLSLLTARLLINRGYKSAEDAKSFIMKSDSFLYDPFLLKDIHKAVKRIEEAIEKNERITIYGDYDVDGITSVSILYMYLKERNADVDYYIPTRESEGYGLNNNAFRTIKDRGTNLVITVDTGITGIDEIAYAYKIGLDVVVTDHHECRPELPKCHAVVNPRRPDCEYPFKELAGVGVIFKVMCALELNEVNCGEYNLHTIKDMCKRYIDLVTIGTIADVMPLYDENRIIVYMGLNLLKVTRNIGVRSLFHAVGIDFSKKITSSTIGYTIAPRINAAGRMGDASMAVELFLSKSPSEADRIAEKLCNVNRERQQIENEIFLEALKQVDEEHDLEKESVLVLASNNWHQGIIGIVSSKITEQFGKPSILISFDDDGIGKGSARSVKGLNMVEALSACESLLIKYGGHEFAAGLSVERKNLKAFREALNAYASEKLSSPDCVVYTDAEAEITTENITIEAVEEMSKLEPYGSKNPEPLFVLRDVTIDDIVPLSDGKHTRLLLKKDGFEVSAVCFGHNLLHEGFVMYDRVDILCLININEFRGNRSVQLIVRDIDLSEWGWNELAKIEEIFEDIRTGYSKCGEEDIPTRAEFAAVYRRFSDKSYLKGKQITLLKLLAPMPQMSYLKLRIILEAFIEADLITFERVNFYTYHIKRLQPTEKKDLHMTPIMQTITEN